VRNVRITLAVGIALVLAVGAFVLTRSPPRVLAANGPSAAGPMYASGGDLQVCQRDETLPAGATAIRLSMWAFLGWKINVKIYEGAHVIAEGRRGPDWTGTSVTVPVKPLDKTVSNVTLCFTTGPNSEPELLLGSPTTQARAASLLEPGVPAPRARVEGHLPGRIGAEYLASGGGSWWSRIPRVIQRIGFGRSFSGDWIAYLLIALMLAVGAITVRLTLREIA
jgi:hypothetical protein